MSFFNTIGRFFEGLFPGKGSLVQRVLHDASALANLCTPIIEEIEAELKALPDQGKNIQAIEKFLANYLPDTEKAAVIAQSLSGMPSADLWKNLAVIALQTMVPGGTTARLLNLAVELAYNIFKQSNAAHPVPVLLSQPKTRSTHFAEL